jgi:transcriptional regulator with PAS, ATPase and Fis domain
MSTVKELRDQLAEAEARELQKALEEAGGSTAKAAAILGVSRWTVWRRMKDHKASRQ